MIYQKYIKRLLDVLLSILGIIFLSPIMLITAVLVRIKLGSPVLFKQKRPGLNERVFTIYKFRTMTKEEDRNGKLLVDSERLTDFGKKLRLTSLDELPELWNILKGDMSIVGPRPLLVKYLNYYTEEEAKRHCVRPGLTGLAQVSGRNYLTWEERFLKDLEYINKISFCNDLKIIIKTFTQVIGQKDVVVNTNEIEGNLAKIREKERSLYL